MHETAEISVSNILLVDDHALLTEGLRQILIKILPDGCSVMTFTSVEKAKASLQHYEYNYLLVDLIMPGQDVSAFIKFCRKQYPQLLIIVISSVVDINIIKSYFAIGVNGYLSKAVNHHELRSAFEHTYNGKKFISSDLSGRIANSILSIENTTLTKKELEVLRLIASGRSTKVIADQLSISPITIMTHKRSLLRKLGLHSSTELVKYAYENQLF